MAFTSSRPSLWWRTDAVSLPPAPRLEDDISAQVVVVGAGIVGLLTARDLAASGVDVVLLEGDSPGAGATGHSSAKVTALQSPRLARLSREHGPDAARIWATANLAAVARLRDELGDDVDLRTAVTWTDRDAEAITIVEELEASRRAGLPVRATSEADGLPIVAGIALDGQLAIDPLVLLRRLAGACDELGVRRFDDTRVTGVSLLGSERTVTTHHGSVRADRVVLATGLPFLDRGLWFARMEPRRAHAIVLRGERVAETMSIRVGGATRSSRPATLPDGTPVTLIAGADHRTGSQPDADPYGDLEEWGHEAFGHGPVLDRWSAQDWRPADGLPLVGALVPGDDRIVAAAGFDKWGLTAGTIAAGVLTSMITGSTPNDVGKLIDPARLRLRAAGPTLLRNQATVGWKMTSGWLRAMGSTGTDPEARGRVVREGLKPVAVAEVDGVEHRCLAVCTHLGGIVEFEEHDGDWACPLHGSRFAVDGAVRSGPAVRPLADA